MAVNTGLTSHCKSFMSGTLQATSRSLNSNKFGTVMYPPQFEPKSLSGCSRDLSMTLSVRVGVVAGGIRLTYC